MTKLKIFNHGDVAVAPRNGVTQINGNTYEIGNNKDATIIVSAIGAISTSSLKKCPNNISLNKCGNPDRGCGFISFIDGNLIYISRDFAEIKNVTVYFNSGSSTKISIKSLETVLGPHNRTITHILVEYKDGCTCCLGATFVTSTPENSFIPVVECIDNVYNFYFKNFENSFFTVVLFSNKYTYQVVVNGSGISLDLINYGFTSYCIYTSTGQKFCGKLPRCDVQGNNNQ